MLTDFQRKIIELNKAGRSNAEIAIALGRTLGSVNATTSKLRKAGLIPRCARPTRTENCNNVYPAQLRSETDRAERLWAKAFANDG